MSYSLESLNTLLLEVQKWNPAKVIANEEFCYLDLGCVDKDNKVILKDHVLPMLGKDAPSRAKQIVKKRDVLVSTVRPNLNGVAMVKEDYKYATASTGYCVLRVKQSLNADYLFYWVRTKAFISDMEAKATGASYPAVSDKIIKESRIPLPTLEEQKKIAAILDAADEYRQKTKALIDKYDQLTQSLFLDIFGDPVTNPMGWDTNELGEILQITSSKRIFKDEYVEEGIPFYRTKEIVELSKGNKISLELFISEKRYSEIKSKYDIPEKGDILLSAVGTIGIMWTVNTEDPFYFKDGNLVWLKSANLEGVDPTYLRMTLEHLIDYEKYKLAEGGAYNALTIAKLKEFNVLLAPYDLQHLFAERIALIEKQKQQAEASLVKAEELFNSLLQKAFKG